MVYVGSPMLLLLLTMRGSVVLRKLLVHGTDAATFSWYKAQFSRYHHHVHVKTARGTLVQCENLCSELLLN